jgi:hypothetical protein
VQQHGQPELGRANAMDQNHQQSSEAAMKYRVGVLCAVFLLSCCLARAEEPAKTAKAAAQPTKKELEKKFQETLSGATLTGHFTSGKEDAAAAKEEKYTIDSVTKVPGGDRWLFNARIQYGGHDVTLPLLLRVVWAGDTPVITLDKFSVPGFGQFTARVMIFDGKYSGMWDGGNHGGLLYGKITKEEKKSKEAKSRK